MELIRLKAQDYEEVLELMNAVFGRKNHRETHFDQTLPKMCHKDDLRMNRHFGIREDGKLVAALGVYPLPTVIAGEKLMFSTVGNVATHWEYEGRGYMSQLLARAMQELDAIGADASRLGGKRARYHRYGYELCGMSCQVNLQPHNELPVTPVPVTFKKIDRTDLQSLAFAKKLNDANLMYVERPADTDFEAVYESLVAWKNIPYLAIADGTPIGYLCASEDETALAEINAVDDTAYLQLLAAWQKRVNKPLSFPIMPQEQSRLLAVTSVCESYSLSAPCQFYIRNFAGVTNALMKMKSVLCDMPDGEWVLGIEGYGSVRLFVKDGKGGAEKTEAAPQITLPAAIAPRVLYGPLPPFVQCAVPGFVQAWLPLPLSWNLQDRV